MSSLSDEEIRLRLLQFLAQPPKIGSSDWGIHKSIIREAMPVPERALDNNVFYLARKGLIKLVQPGTQWLWARITPVGLDALQNPKKYKEQGIFV